MKKINIITFIVICILFLISLFFNYRLYKQRNKYEIKIDTIYCKDSILVSNEVIKEKVKFKYLTFSDTTFSYKKDSIFITDTIKIPISHYEYKDTINNDSINYFLNIKYSGYKANLDTLSISTKFLYQTPTIIQYKNKKWGHGLNLGIGVGYDFKNTPFFGVYFGYGLHRNF